MENDKDNGRNDSAQLDVLSEVLPLAINLFRRLDEEGREKLFRTLSTLFGFDQPRPTKLTGVGTTSVAAWSAPERFSQDRTLSVKEFLMKKQPRTDVERVACLAYYLTHYMDQRHFKTVDISRLNTEAAQLRFANPAFAVANAANLGYLAPATKGNKQISAAGEVFVDALPDRDAARAAMASARPKRRQKKNHAKGNKV